MSERKRLMLIDGHALAFRAFFAMANANLRTSSGEPTYAVFGFAQILLGMCQEHQPHYVAVAFDVGRTFRDDMYAEYKAGRAETPAEFRPQLERIKQVVQTLNIPIYTADNYEADDVIGTLARQATGHGLDTLILTGDTDTLQLVDEHVHVLMANPYGQKTTTTLYDEERVRERYKGLGPHQLADLRGLKGDSSDNIPGVKGVGEAGAIALLNQFGSVEALYERLDEAPTRYRKKLEGQHEAAHFSKQLSQIVCDVPVTLDVAATELADYDRDRVLDLFQQLEFGSSLVKKLPTPPGQADQASQASQANIEPLPTTSSSAAMELPATVTVTAPAGGSSMQMSMFAEAEAPAAPPPASSGDYQAVTTEDALGHLIDALNAAPALAFDTESTGLDAIGSALVGISLAVRPGAAWYIPLAHREGQQLPAQSVLNALRPFFADANLPKYAHNAKFDIELLAGAGLEVRGLAFDTLLAAQLLGRQRRSLKELAFYELHPPQEMTDIAELIGRGAKQITFDQVPIAQALPYAAADADMTLRLTETLRPQLAAQADAQKLFERLELPLVPILVRMEQAGIGIDVAYMRELSSSLGERIAGIEQQVHELAGTSFNINSGPQLNDVLFERLQLPTAGLSKTSTGRYSLTADALEKLEGEHEIVRLILQYRQLAKLKSTYVDALPDLVNPRTGRIHTSYSQIGTSTGRLSSAHPNLQNIPVRTHEGSEIRRAFVAKEGCRFLAADYSQIELRVLAHITQDSNLLQAFQEGQDIHSATAAQLFEVAPDAVDKEQRRTAKMVVFGVIYGISSFGLSQRTGLERSQSQALIDALFARFPGIRAYIDQTLDQGRSAGYVQSLFGRRRAMPELASKGPRRQAAEREAINAPIQATAADIMKLAMIQIDEALRQQQVQTTMLLQVHDELIFEVPHDEMTTVSPLVRQVMEQVCELRVPLQVDIETGTNWEEMEEVGAP